MPQVVNQLLRRFHADFLSGSETVLMDDFYMIYLIDTYRFTIGLLSIQHFFL